MDLTLSTLKATVEKLPSGDIIRGDGDLYIYREKEDLYSFYLPTYLGVNPENGLAMFAKDPTKPDTEDNRTYRYVEAKKRCAEISLSKGEWRIQQLFPL